MSLGLGRLLHRQPAADPAVALGPVASAGPVGSGPDITAPTAAVPVPSRSRRLGLPPLLLRWKLTIFYSAVLALMLSTFSILVYWYMSRSMLADIDRNSERQSLTAVRALQNLVSLEQLVMANPPGQLGLAQEIQTRLSLEKVLADSRYDGMAVRVYAAGHWVCPGSSDIIVANGQYEVHDGNDVIKSKVGRAVTVSAAPAPARSPRPSSPPPTAPPRTSPTKASAAC